jgi:VIT1/CCC1 family predicted Fe2+/Mn2+ transporter
VSDQPRDWEKELAAIDRAIERQPQSQPPAAAPRGGPAPAASPTPSVGTTPPGRGATTTAWLRVLLVVLLGAAMPLWPYSRGCGVGLFAYLAAAGVVVLGGVWAAVSTWHRRRPVAHIVALLVTLWGMGLITAEVLPRVGYAKQAVRWTCG